MKLKHYPLTLLLICGFFACKPKDPFPEKDVCILLTNAHTGAVESTWNEKRCRERFPACSTFKVPLALMAFDAQILRDERQTLPWDGQRRMLEAWNRDHNAETWMRDSVVWFSQRLTPLLGEAKIQKYLSEFAYGNGNIAAGLTDAWLRAPDSNEGALSISAYEQTAFFRKLFDDQLRVSAAASALTKQILYHEISPRGYTLSGKTGSNTYNAEKGRRLGWFVGYLERGSEAYTVAVNFSDTKATADSTLGGKVAREITKTYLAESGLW